MNILFGWLLRIKNEINFLLTSILTHYMLPYLVFLYLCTDSCLTSFFPILLVQMGLSGDQKLLTFYVFLLFLFSADRFLLCLYRCISYDFLKKEKERTLKYEVNE